MHVFLMAILALALTACGASGSRQTESPTAAMAAAVGPSPLRPFPETQGFIHCVPFARAVTGIDIYGDAGTWWNQAAGRYARGQRPEIGAVLTLRPDRRLRLGHVAVVVGVKGEREILVSHANWGSDGDTRGVVHARQPVIDVSPANDWSAVKLMNTKGGFGRVYPAHGFIYQAAATQTTAAMR